MKIFYYIRRFWAVTKIEKILILKAISLFFFGRFVIKLLPLKYYLSILQYDTETLQNKGANNQFNRVIRLTTKRICKILPFKISCLEGVFISAYLSKSLDIQYQIRLYLSLKNKNSLIAHSEIFFDTELFKKSNNKITSIVIC